MTNLSTLAGSALWAIISALLVVATLEPVEISPHGSACAAGDTTGTCAPHRA